MASTGADMHPKRHKAVGKAASWVLRHGAPSVGVDIRSDGYVKMKDLLRCSAMTKHGATREEMVHIVETNDKKRYEIMREGGVEYIRAVQGHSIEGVDTEKLLVEIKSPEELPMCCHGTYLQAWEFIKESGLSRMARNHIHFVESFDSHADSGAISGLRGNCQVLVFIDVPLAMSHGISFYRATNGVVLSVGDPAAPDGNLHPAFFLRVEDAKTHSPLAGWSRPALPSWHAAATAAQTAAGAGAAGEGSTPAAATSAKEGAAAVAAGTEQVPAHSSYVGHAPMPAGPPAGAPKSPFRYAIVLDFEATCEDSASGRPAPSPQEIIEFPSVVVDLRSGGLVSEFQAYVRPTHHPALTPFCTELTGISQKVTDAADTFPGVLQRWAAWVEGQGLDAVGAGGRPIACLVTCGDWDLRKCLPAQAKAVDPPIDLYFGEGLPTHLFSRWINLKTAFKAAYGSAPRGMVGMLEELGLPLTGRHHSGIDDCRNLASIVLRMLQDGHGAALRPTTVAPAVTRAAKGGGAPSAWGK